MNSKATGTSRYCYTGFWIRFGAVLIDLVILALATFPPLLMIYGEAYFYSQSHVRGTADLLISYAMPFVATVVFWTCKSATPGKMVFKAMIVDAKTGKKPTVKQSIIRYLGYFVAMLPLMLGFFWILWDAKKQGWHDKLAGTVVIRPQPKDTAGAALSGG